MHDAAPTTVPPPAPSPRDREIIRLARREVDPATAAEFAPLTRGPVVAVLGLGLLGAAAAAYLVQQRVWALFRRSR